MKPKNIFLRIRTYDLGWSSVWLIEKKGIVESYLLYGSMLTTRANELADVVRSLGIKIKRQKQHGTFKDEPKPEHWKPKDK